MLALTKLLLVTTKIRCKNTRCPVINNHGMVVGVASAIPAGKGDSDVNIGYGEAYSIRTVENMIGEGNVKKIKFVDILE